MRVGSLFSGIGGLDLGLERAGMSVVWQCEADPYCRAVLRKHWPDVPCYEDVRDIGADVPPVDLLCGGFPCQPVSFAGKGLAQADERWLWPEVARIVRALRPRVVLMENVPGLLARGLGDVLGDLAASGYDAEWDCIPAAAVGAPHLRYRVFIVGYADGVRRMGWRSAPSEGAGLVLADANHASPEFGREEPAGWAVPQWLAGWWEVEPDVGRVADGVPSRVDRLRTLGNAVVPQVAEWIGRRLMNTEVVLRRNYKVWVQPDGTEREELWTEVRGPAWMSAVERGTDA